MMHLVTAILFLSSLALSQGADDMRLLEFNETYRVWMPMDAVEKLVAECGAGEEGHFMDITDFPTPVKTNQSLRAIPTIPAFQTTVRPLLAQLSQTRTRSHIQTLSDFYSRYYTSTYGLEAADWLYDTYTSYAGGRSDITVEKFEHSWLQPSIIATIQGTEDDVVIIGGHIDSTAANRAPGADDDASGSVNVLEVFTVLATQGFQPKRTLEFHGYAAEEVGLRGSQDIANYYANTGKEVYAMLQLDMTAYVRAGTNPTIGVVTDFTTAAVSNFNRRLVEEYCDIGWTNTQCGYACSDHASFYRAGYPSSFSFESIFSNSNPYIHTANDVITHLNIAHSLEFSKLALAYAVELSLAP